MSKYASYVETMDALEELKRKAALLEKDESVQKVIGFQAKLNDLMEKYKVSRADVLQMWGVEEKISKATKTPKSAKPAKAGDKRFQARPLKTYKNPHTGEVVKTKGGNHKVLNAWRETYGKDVIDAWMV
ncbi:MAG: DNA binding protein [Hahellaceae bacterium]|nr:DNA binding protein [Hahellaceae bacterium]